MHAHIYLSQGSNLPVVSGREEKPSGNVVCEVVVRRYVNKNSVKTAGMLSKMSIVQPCFEKV
jgi:hypothetical protein